ncbi:MAG: choice-of-anchor D domain-containing protein, partial [bacterium]
SDTGAVAGSLTVFSNDPDEETLAVALAGNGLAPDIALSETSHDFGDVLVGDSSDWVLQIYNLGTADLIIDSILAAPAEFEFSPTAFPDTIAPTESLTVTVTFSPADTGTVSGNLVLYCSDPDEGVVFVLLTGRGVVPDIAIDPDSLEITVWEGGTISTPLSVINEGTARLIFEMSSDSLWLSQNPDSGGVDPQETLIVEVIFDATSLTIGDYYDTIRVVSNDPDEPELTVPVHLTVREAQVVVSIPDAWSLPGATVEMTMDIDNQTERDDPVAAFQAHLTFVDTLLTVLNVVPTPRIDGLFDWSNPDPGRLIIVFATSELEAIESGTGPVAQITFEVSASATVGDSTPISFENVILSDTLGYPIPMRTEDGTLFLGTGLKGDVNLDGEVNILDAVWIINYILEQIEFTPFQFWAADCNEDGEVNILDVVGIINVILEIGTCPPTPGTAKAAVATARVWSPAESIGPGAKSIELPIFVDSAIDIAGMQLKLSYNPTAQTLGTPQLSGRSAHMTLASNATSGELTILVYSPEGEAIPAGTGPVLTIPLQTHDTRRKRQDATPEFSEVVLAGEGCQEIPLEIRPISLKSRRLPETWSLEQNYPNPFNPVTTIRYALAVTGERGLVSSPVHTTLKIYNILGQEIRTLVDEPKEPGYYTVTWDGKDSFGNDVTSGIYFYRLTAGSYNDTKRMVLLK